MDDQIKIKLECLNYASVTLATEEVGDVLLKRAKEIHKWVTSPPLINKSNHPSRRRNFN